MAWINKIKQMLIGFLSTEDNRYIITDTGKKILCFDYHFNEAIKTDTVFSERIKASTVFRNKDKS